MNEHEAREWLRSQFAVSRETMARLDLFADLLVAESSKQNLISISTIPALWVRHIADSAQLLLLDHRQGKWIDLGTGAGFPGIIVALLSDRPITLVEQRRKRVEFLQRAIGALELRSQVTLRATAAERAPAETFATISARAFAPLDRLFEVAGRFAGAGTRWLLPKGRGAQAELDAATGTWQGSFRVVPSVTDPQSAIVVAENVSRRNQR